MTCSRRWIPPLDREGAWQMAIDEWLLDQVLASQETDPRPVVRLYQWNRPTLSIGFHQRQLPDHWHQLVGTGRMDLVRRPSGGRAVLHGGDVSYCLLWPDPPRRRPQAYQQACAWLQHTFQGIGLPLQFGRQAVSLERGNCFASSTAADLVHGCGTKRIGSAQLWRQGCLLQHGSIQINPSQSLWQAVFGSDPPALPELPISIECLMARLGAAAERFLPLGAAGAGLLTEEPLTRLELEAVAQRLHRYSVASWDQGSDRMSPARCIDSTT